MPKVETKPIAKETNYSSSEANYFYNSKLKSLLTNAKRPMLLLGGGCRMPILKDLENILNSLKIPFVTTWLGYDLISTKNDLHIGNLGMSGQRGANILAANADLLICIGSSVSTSVTSTLTLCP